MLSRSFKGAYYNGSAAPVFVETTDINDIYFWGYVSGCRMSCQYPNPIRPVSSFGIAAGLVYMNDGTLAPVCSIKNGARLGYYNSVTKKIYYINNNVVSIASNIRLLHEYLLWMCMRHPISPAGTLSAGANLGTYNGQMILICDKQTRHCGQK